MIVGGWYEVVKESVEGVNLNIVEYSTIIATLTLTLLLEDVMTTYMPVVYSSPF